MTTQEATQQIIEDVMDYARCLAARSLLEAVAVLPVEGLTVHEYRRLVLNTLQRYSFTKAQRAPRGCP
jgi:hypothetical protein